MALKVLIGLAALVGCCGSGRVAPAGAPPAAPRIVRHPAKLATTATARFVLVGPADASGYECRLDRGRWRRCRTPLVFAGIEPGSHAFFARAVYPGSAHSAAAVFRWRLLEPRDFTIVPELSSLGALYPGAAPQALPVRIENPNSVPILVTALRASVSSDPAGCPSAENLQLEGSSVSGASPLRVPAGGSVELPAPGVSAPTIQLRDLPVNQDACQGARFPLEFSGSARG